MAANRANMLSDLEALANVASGGRPGQLGNILRHSDVATNFAIGDGPFGAYNGALQAQHNRGLKGTSEVAIGRRSEGGMKLTSGLEATVEVAQRLVNGRTAGRKETVEPLPTMSASVAGAGSAYASAANLHSFPSTIGDEDLNEKSPGADHGKTKQAENMKVIARGDDKPFHKKKAKMSAKGKGGSASHGCEWYAEGTGLP